MNTNKENEMVRGYLAGFNSTSDQLPDCHKNKSVAFRHGWLNGRDDRLGNPREKANVLLRRAEMIIGMKHDD